MRASSFGLAFVLASTGGRAWAGPAAQGADAMISIEVADGIGDADLIEEWIRDDGKKVLAAHKLDAASTDRRLVVEIGGKDTDYSVAIDVVEAGAPVEGGRTTFECACTYEQLVTKTLQSIVDKVPTMRGDAGPSGDRGAGTTEPEPTTNGGEKPSGRKPLGGLGKAGIGVMVAGVATLVTGGALLGVGRRVETGVRTEGTDFKPPGIALAATGGVLLVVGIALLATDRARARKRTAAVVPAFGPRFAGIAVVGRY
jgi:hypothetical protein